MQTPSVVDRETFNQRLEEYLETQQHDEKSGYRCSTCNAEIQAITAAISVHSNMFSGCAGGGEVKQVAIPYCPNCEEKPSTHGCVHVDH